MNRDGQAGPLTERTELTRIVELGTQPVLAAAVNRSPGFDLQSSNKVQQSVELHIGELVLHGFDPASRHAIGEAIERELTRLFTEQGPPPAITQNGEIAHLDGGALEISAESNAETIGIRLAKAIYGGFGQ